MQKAHLPSGTVRKRMGEIHAEVQAWPQRMKEAIGMSDEKKEGVAAFFGTWPGDETDEEMLAMLKDVRREFGLTDEERAAIKVAIDREVAAHWGTSRNNADVLIRLLERTK